MAAKSNKDNIIADSRSENSAPSRMISSTNSRHDGGNKSSTKNNTMAAMRRMLMITRSTQQQQQMPGSTMYATQKRTDSSNKVQPQIQPQILPLEAAAASYCETSTNPSLYISHIPASSATLPVPMSNPTKKDYTHRTVRYSGDLELPLPFDRDPAQRPSQDLRTLADSTFVTARSNSSAGHSHDGSLKQNAVIVAEEDSNMHNSCSTGIRSYNRTSNRTGAVYPTTNTTAPAAGSPLRNSFFGGLRNSLMGIQANPSGANNHDNSNNTNKNPQMSQISARSDMGQQSHAVSYGVASIGSNNHQNLEFMPPPPPSKNGASDLAFDPLSFPVPSTPTDASQMPLRNDSIHSNTPRILSTPNIYEPAQVPFYLQYRFILHTLAILCALIAFSIMIALFQDNYTVLSKAVFSSMQFFIIVAAATWIASLLYLIWFNIGSVALADHPFPLLATDNPFGATIDIVATTVLVLFWLSTCSDTMVRTLHTCYSLDILEDIPGLCLSARISNGFGIAAGALYLAILAMKIYEYSANGLWRDLKEILGNITPSKDHVEHYP
ncbi:hypothetical protein BASA62_008490 [Batrachochytrium salamandrivorans]|nr:hypothetical protein BASA62_008490 [Batrachochytrium salamandrivorans]